MRWWFPLFALVAAPLLLWNAYELVRIGFHLAVVWEPSAVDFNLLARASHVANPFAFDTYRWSPVAAPLLALVTPLGITVWRMAQLGALFAFRDRRVIAVALVTFPFWTDVVSGQVMTYVALAAWWAFRGSRAATIAWFCIAILMPRPLVVPLTVWLLWQRPQTRPWFAVIFLAHALLVLESGLGADWVGRLLSSGSEIIHPENLGPTRLLGMWWMAVGLPFAAWFTYRGRLGLASMAAQPYWFGYYFLVLALESCRQHGADLREPVVRVAPRPQMIREATRSIALRMLPSRR